MGIESELIALFDLDGTLCDHDGALRRDYDRIKSPSDPPYSPFGKDSSPEHIRNRINLIRNQEGWWQNLPQLEIGFNILEIAKELGFRINILTKGPRSSQNAWTEKVRWVEKNLGPVPITLTEDKSMVYGRVLVDDYPGYTDAWLKQRPRGLVVMPDQEWNQGYSHQNVMRCDGSNLREVRKAMEIAKYREASKELKL